MSNYDNRQFDQEEQLETSEQDDRDAAFKAAYPETDSASISSFTPTSGAVGASVTINGSGFTGASGVSFNGTAAVTFAVVDDSKMTATVPAGATTGKIAVTAPGGPVGQKVATAVQSATNFTVS